MTKGSRKLLRVLKHLVKAFAGPESKSAPAPRPVNRPFLLSILNRETCNESLQVIAYNMLNVPGYRPTAQEWAAIVAERLIGPYRDI